jgi:hypothetical protein
MTYMASMTLMPYDFPHASLALFDHDGLLLAGDYELDFQGLRESFLATGAGGKSPTWDAPWRKFLNNLQIMTEQLWSVGVTEVFADGSFVEEKDHPNDIDGYFVCSLQALASGELTCKLDLLDPHKIWTWDPRSRQAHRGYPKKQLPMWHRYRVELYPHVAGLLSGIRDPNGHELEFPSAFRQSRRDGKPRGIIKLKPGASP